MLNRNRSLTANSMSGGESLASRSALFLHLHSFAQAHRKLLANEPHWKCQEEEQTDDPSAATLENSRPIIHCALIKGVNSMFLEPWTCIASSKRPLFDVAN